MAKNMSLNERADALEQKISDDSMYSFRNRRCSIWRTANLARPMRGLASRLDTVSII